MSTPWYKSRNIQGAIIGAAIVGVVTVIVAFISTSPAIRQSGSDSSANLASSGDNSPVINVSGDLNLAGESSKQSGANATQYVSRDVQKSPNGLKAILRFTRTQPDAPWGRHTVSAELPKNSKARILSLNGFGTGSFFDSSVATDGKSASATYTPFLELSFVIEVSEPIKVTISGNHGLETEDVMIE